MSQRHEGPADALCTRLDGIAQRVRGCQCVCGPIHRSPFQLGTCTRSLSFYLPGRRHRHRLVRPRQYAVVRAPRPPPHASTTHISGHPSASLASITHNLSHLTLPPLVRSLTQLHPPSSIPSHPKRPTRKSDLLGPLHAHPILTQAHPLPHPTPPAMSSGEEDFDNETGAQNNKKRRVQRACDICRRKKGTSLLLPASPPPPPALCSRSYPGD